MRTDNETIYQQIQREVEQAIQCFGIDFRLSGDISAAVTRKLQKRFGSSTVYFTEKTVSTEEHYAAIRRDFDGSNHDEVRKMHGISKRTLYRAIEKQAKY